MANLPPLRQWAKSADAQKPIAVDPRNERVRDEPLSPLEPLLRLLALLRRRMWLVLPVTIATFGMAAYKVYTDPLVYRATAVIRLSDERRVLTGDLAGDGSTNVGAPLSPGTDPGLSLIQLLRSRVLAREVVEKEGLRLQVLSTHLRTNLLNPRPFPASLLKSLQVASSEAADTLRLQMHFSKDGVTAQGSRSKTRAAYGMPLELEGVRFTVVAYPGLESADFIVVPINQAVNTLLEDLRAEPREKTDVIDVHYTANDPGMAQRVVNTAVQVFQAANARTAQQRSVERREFIEAQLKRSDSLLSQAELALKKFRSREQLYSSRERLLAQQTDLTRLEVRRGELAADRRMYQNLLTAVERPARGTSVAEQLGALVSAPGIAENPVVSQLYGQMTRYQATRDSLTAGTGGIPAGHPDVKRLDTLVASTVGKIAIAVRGQLAAMDARLSALDELTSRSSAEMSVLPSVHGQEESLVQRVEAYRRTADLLREKLQEARIGESLKVGQVEVVDFADLPTVPIGGSRTAKLLFGLVLGLVLGGGSAYFFENRKTVIRGQEEMEAALLIPNLALIPRFKIPNGNTRRRLLRAQKGNGRTGQPLETMSELETLPDLVTLLDLRSTGAEAYRMLRTNLLLSESVRVLKKLVVTSAIPREGKTTTAANLAVTCAQQGYRVLLVDCDLRSPQIHKLFRVPLEPGLTQLLLGSTVTTDVLRSTPLEQLFVVTAGGRYENPSELVGSARLRTALEELSGMFEMVILDTPPVLVASESAVLSKEVDGVLVVVRAGHTERESARRAVHQLMALGARVVGTVLNDPDAGEAKYGASYGYFYDRSDQSK